MRRSRLACGFTFPSFSRNPYSHSFASTCVAKPRLVLWYRSPWWSRNHACVVHVPFSSCPTLIDVLLSAAREAPTETTLNSTGLCCKCVNGAISCGMMNRGNRWDQRGESMATGLRMRDKLVAGKVTEDEYEL